MVAYYFSCCVYLYNSILALYRIKTDIFLVVYVDNIYKSICNKDIYRDTLRLRMNQVENFPSIFEASHQKRSSSCIILWHNPLRTETA